MNETSDVLRGPTACFSKAGLKIGDGSKLGTATAAPNGAGIDFCINGIAYHKAESNTDVPLIAAAVQAVLTKCLYLIVIDSAGTITSVKGTAVLTADLSAGIKALQWPECPANKCPIGAVKIALANAATFTPGTTALDATDVTATYYDFAGGMPTAPLTS